MPRSILLLAPFFLLSCGVNLKRAAAPRPLPPVVESVVRSSAPDMELEEDSYAEAAEFWLLKRAAAGGDLPVERYLDAKRHVERMPLYSLAQRRFVGAAEKSAARDANVGAWQPLGPGNVGGRTRSFL